jgi:hypothetical protein
VCEGDTIPVVDPTYNRVAILAIPDEDFVMTPANGIARLVTVTNPPFDPLLTVIDPPEGD